MSDAPPPVRLPGDGEILRALLASDWLIIAAVTAAAGLVAYLILDPMTAALAMVFAALAVTVAAADTRLLLVPDALSLALFIIGLAGTTLLAIFDADPFGFADPWWMTLLLGASGAIVAAAILAALRWIWFRVRGVEAIGFGDVKLAGALGAWLGPVDLFYAFLVASLAGLLMVVFGRRFGIAAIAAREIDARLPFAALLAPSAWLVFTLGRM